jgi:hypothetical protein
LSCAFQDHRWGLGLAADSSFGESEAALSGEKLFPARGFRPFSVCNSPGHDALHEIVRTAILSRAGLVIHHLGLSYLV